MLVLERKCGETISLFVEGQHIKITLASADKGRAKLGIDAPDETLVLRGEILSASPESLRKIAMI
ncbi:MAG: carbon storage regulator [Gammaproteobacteria bacterium]|nr:carbon storage regulator [Gammaproteobacteria bacterium]